MKYQSSRGKYNSISSAEAIKMGISPDGGLFVPDYIPVINENEFKKMKNWAYQERACYVFEKYLTDFSDEEIKNCVYEAYREDKFSHEEFAPLVKLDSGVFVQELWHGPTAAFKDMALQVLPHLMTASARKTGETGEIVILVATSGDTGKAALEGFSDVQGTRIIVFYPNDGVSEVQKQQMISQEGNNVHVAAVTGNFDDAQNGVKIIFGQQEFIDNLAAHNLKMSSANSINWGRLLPQIVYYISAYVDLLAKGELSSGQKINIAVPTGNFGNILAAYYASRMGVPINKLICAANSNNVLTDFIKTGIYDRNRCFEKTISPSMDILISSNLERLLYELTGHDADRVAGWMEQLKNGGSYEVDNSTREAVQNIFWSDFATDEETIAAIRFNWDKYHYLLDTHTAVAFNVLEKYREVSADNTPTIIASTASPFKFGSSVAQAVLEPGIIAGKNEFALMQILSDSTGIPIPEGLRGLDQKAVRHQTISSRDGMEETVMSFLKI